MPLVMCMVGPISVSEAVAASAVNTAIEINAAMIVVLTETGGTVQQVNCLFLLNIYIYFFQHK